MAGLVAMGAWSVPLADHAWAGANVKCIIRLFIDDCSGATIIEYGLVAILISTAIILVLLSAGAELSALYQDIYTGLSGA